MDNIRSIITGMVMLVAAYGAGYHYADHSGSNAIHQGVEMSYEWGAHTPLNVSMKLNDNEFFNLTNELIALKKKASKHGMNRDGVIEVNAIADKLSLFPKSVHWTPGMRKQLEQTKLKWELSDAEILHFSNKNKELESDLKSTTNNLVNILDNLCH